MTMHVHHLRGCAPAPLAHYLKALGILRLVSEQADATARLWWQDEHACLATTLDESALIAFFAETYRPTPMVAPWNAGSGFYPKENDDEGVDDQDENGDSAGSSDLLEMLVQSSDARFVGWREAIRNARSQECAIFRETLDIARVAKAAANRNKKDKTLAKESKEADEKKKALKDQIVLGAFKTWRGQGLEWLSAAAVCKMGPDTGVTVFYPQHLGGSGGANAKLDFTINFAECLLQLLSDKSPLREKSEPLLREALFSGPSLVDPSTRKDRSLGQFMPRTTKAPNGTAGFQSDREGNPWDLVLLIEGSLLLRCGVAKRHGDNSPFAPSAPFSVQSSLSSVMGGPVGKDNSASEQWLPLWKRASSLDELQCIFSEGRISIGRKIAANAMDVSRSLARFGTQRGIDRFVRYGYPQRNGKGHFATNLGTWRVQFKSNFDVIDASADWIQRLTWNAKGKTAPTAWATAARRCEETLLACSRGSEPRHCVALLMSLGDAEASLARTPAKARDAGLRPLARLPASWLTAIPNEPWLRLAVAIAAQLGDDPPLRHHWHTVDEKNKFEFAKAADVEVVVTHRAFVPDAVAILRRRCRHAGVFNLQPGHHHAAGLADLAALVRNEVDTDQMWSVVRPLLALNWTDSVPLTAPPARGDDLGQLAVAGLLRLAHAPMPLPGAERVLTVDPTILARLLAGDVPGAVAIAARRLHGIGLRSHIVSAVGNRSAAQRLAATLIVPLHPTGLATLAARLTRPQVDSVIAH